MYVCICNAITDKQIHRAAEAGVTDLWGLQAELGVAAGCGRCKEHAMDVLRDSMHRQAEPALYAPSAA